MCIARTPEGRAAVAAAAAVPPPMTAEEAVRQAEAEGLTLLTADNNTGFKGVVVDSRNKGKPYQAQVQRKGKRVFLGSFATAEEAALCIARTPEGRAAGSAAAAAPPPTDDGGGGGAAGRGGGADAAEVRQRHGLQGRSRGQHAQLGQALRGDGRSRVAARPCPSATSPRPRRRRCAMRG